MNFDAETSARMTPAGLMRYESQGTLKHYPHVGILNRLWLELMQRTIKRAMVWMPPQHGKSTINSKYGPAWYVGNMPNERFILLTYAADYGRYWGAQTRDLIVEHGPALFGISVNPRQSAAHWWHVQGHRGYMATAGVDGQVTGKQAHGFLIDDSIKGPKEAMSVAARREIWNAYQSVVKTRLAKGAFQLHTATRWHHDDIDGRVLKEAQTNGQEWLVIRLPALAEEDETPETIVSHSTNIGIDNPAVARIAGNWSRKAGEALCEDLHPRAELEEIKAGTPSQWWSALFQQRPQIEGGGYFKASDFRYWNLDNGMIELRGNLDDQNPKRWRRDQLRILFAVDLAISAKQSADFTVVSIFGISPDRDLLWLDMWRKRIETGHQQVIKQLYSRWKPYKIMIESVQFQASIVNELRREGFPVKPVPVDRDKVQRALLATTYTEQHKLFLPSQAEWLDDCENELIGFDRAEHDDIVDTLSMAVTELPNTGFKSVVSY